MSLWVIMNGTENAEACYRSDYMAAEVKSSGVQWSTRSHQSSDGIKNYKLQKKVPFLFFIFIIVNEDKALKTHTETEGGRGLQSYSKLFGFIQLQYKDK